MRSRLDSLRFSDILSESMEEFGIIHKDAAIDVCELGSGGRILVRLCDYENWAFAAVDLNLADMPETEEALEAYWKTIFTSLYDSLCLRRKQISQNLQRDE